MGGFTVVSDAPKLLWRPIDYAAGDIQYVGAIVRQNGDGVGHIGADNKATGTAVAPIRVEGVIVATNDYNKAYDTTVKADKITGLNTQAALAARDYRGVEGVWGKGDSQPFVQIARITGETVLKGCLYNSTLGTAPTVVTVSTGSATGLGYTATGQDFTPVSEKATIYCRSGANKGIYRVSSDTSTTVKTTAVPFPNDIAVGDTFVSVPLVPNGECQIRTDAEARFIDISADGHLAAATYIRIHVEALDLSEAGKECVYFRFAAAHL